MFSIQKYGGVTKYFCELIKNITPENEYKLSVLFSANHYLKEDKKIFNKIYLPIPDKNFRLKGRIKNLIYTANEHFSKKIIKSQDYDLFHPTYYGTYFLGKLKKPYVLTVHDLIAFKDDFYTDIPLRNEMKRTIENATRIISISENTKKDLTDILNIDPQKIDVIYHGYNKPKSEYEKNNLGKYILFVGRRSGYKNFSTFASAISLLFKKEKDLKLVCVGEPFNSKEASMLKRLNILEKTTVLTANEEKLNNLYSNALTFVYPTLYEGFGMPILEAFANKCPICVSNTSCLPEIAGDAAVYFDPYSEASILKAMEKIIFSRSLSLELIKKGESRLSSFSWQKTAAHSLNTYKRTLSFV
jgi:glycosyltransferase involved in cell wall biosynthesis